MPAKIICFGVIFVLFAASLPAAPLRIENVVRIKGQETTAIRGYGIVSGLNATGDDPKSYTPAAKAILRQLNRSGMSGSDEKGINTAKNNALVEVTVTIPASGGRDGDLLDCTVVSVGNAKSLAGGVLSATMLATPLPQDETTEPRGMASGRITTEQPASPNVGRIIGGCRLIGDFTNPYIQDGIVTLVVKKEFSFPRMANQIAYAINEYVELKPFAPAKAVNSHYIAVKIPATYYADPMEFISEMLDIPIAVVPKPVPRVTINERVGVIAIDEDVQVRPTLVTHRNIIAEVPPVLQPGEQEQLPRQFVDVDSDMKLRQLNGENVQNMKLKALQASLDAVRVTPQDMIEIIKILKAQGAIVGEVVFVE
ncbi:MAG: flagellar basal body P-ring protein FlgI [Planctomycetaceae bacterium]|jgi:flagellar P-ring protein precursor FlgI|nr:flagellar basal body P-ring protein FlgI [Planctomycetaceae bacterium]